MNRDSSWYLVTGGSSGTGKIVATILFNRGKNFDIKQYTVRAV